MKSVFITGGANGIGFATAKLFAGKGWRVGIGDLMPPATLPYGVNFYPLDVRDRVQWDAALGAFADAGDGALDVLVNNAGVVRYGHFEDIAPADADLIVDVNLKGVINGAYAGLPRLRRRPGSCLVNIASAGALYGGPDLAVYTATKFAVRGLSEALDTEFAPYGVEVRCVMPWFTDTAMVEQTGQGCNRSLKDDFGGFGMDAADVPAIAIWNAVRSKRLHHLVGFRTGAMSLMVRLCPNVMRRSSRSQRMKAQHKS